MARRTLLCLDTASPTVSVAAARGGRAVAEEREPIARSSVRLLPMIDAVLEQAGVPRAALGELGGLVVLGGPGSFTGLRVGMATALGLHQATGVAATAVSTFDALAAWLERSRPPRARRAAFAGVDVLRGEWAVQRYCRTGAAGAFEPEGDARRLARSELIAEARAAGAAVVGFAAGRLAGEDGGAELSLEEPDALAAPIAAALSLVPPAWDAERLTRPVYFRPPAVTLPKPR